MMKKTAFLIAIVFLITIPLNAAFAGMNLNPGKWEITTTTEMVGVPGMAGMVPPATHTQCLSKEELVPQSEAASEECKLTDIRQDGDSMLWNITCSGKNGEMEGDGIVTYHGDTMTGKMNMVIKGAGMQIINKISGKRVGACN